MSDRQRPVKYRERAKKTLLEFQATAWLLYFYSLPFFVCRLMATNQWPFVVVFNKLWLFFRCLTQCRLDVQGAKK
jgi:hypothetical protein